MPIILRRILFSMITRRQDRHLMAINRVIVEKVARLFVDLARAVLVPPHVK